jgi:hypothetical protein
MIPQVSLPHHRSQMENWPGVRLGMNPQSGQFQGTATAIIMNPLRSKHTESPLAGRIMSSHKLGRINCRGNKSLYAYCAGIQKSWCLMIETWLGSPQTRGTRGIMGGKSDGPHPALKAAIGA